MDQPCPLGCPSSASLPWRVAVTAAVKAAAVFNTHVPPPSRPRLCLAAPLPFPPSQPPARVSSVPWSRPLPALWSLHVTLPILLQPPLSRPPPLRSPAAGLPPPSPSAFRRPPPPACVSPPPPPPPASTCPRVSLPYRILAHRPHGGRAGGTPWAPGPWGRGTESGILPCVRSTSLCSRAA